MAEETSSSFRSDSPIMEQLHPTGGWGVLNKITMHNPMRPMKYSTKHIPVRRTAALLCAALVGLSLAAARTSAQTVTGPLPTSPETPTPFQAPVFHSGGGPGTTTYPIDTASAPYLDPLLDPLQSQLQGTPTEIAARAGGGVPTFTQIPSFLLGNYDPSRPPTGLISDGAGGSINQYFPNHFADGTIFSWAAPFVYNLVSSSSVTVDDSAAPPTPATGVATISGFTQNGFTAITDPALFPSAGTATSGEYLRLPPRAANDANIYRADWTLVQPTTGNYSLYFHIPNDLPSAAGATEVRSTAVTYFVAVRDAAGNVTRTTTATASQTEANDTQFLAGPFQVASGGSVGVTLLQSKTVNNSPLDYLVADSMTLQPSVGDVQSAPTAITRNRFLAEFGSLTHPLQYWGIYVPTAAALIPTNGVNGAPPPGTSTTQQLVDSAVPDTTLASVNAVDPATGASTLNAGNVVLKSGAQADPLRLIRQLVYFGRSDPTASVSNSVDDSAALPSGNPLSGFSGTGTQVANTTASSGEYKVSAASGGAITTASPVATWTVPVPNAGVGTGFFVYAHIPATPAGEVRSNHVVYTITADGVTSNPVFISQQTQGTDALVVLPTGAIQAAAGSSIVVRLYSVNNLTTAPPANTVVVADSVTVSTGTGQGAIYCVDGFNGGVIWRYETPGSAGGSSSAVFSSPAVSRINVMVTPPVYSTAGTVTTPAVYASRLVVIVGDNNGLVYCLDAIGNGDGTSNVNVLAKDANGPIPGQPNTVPQPAYPGPVPAYPGNGYGADLNPAAPNHATPLVAGTLATTAAATAHVGTTGTYWVYRPDSNRPKYVIGNLRGKVKPIDPTTDLPVPAAFNTASPVVFVDPTVSTTPDATNLLKSNAKVYLGNTNGVLYALDALGVALNGTTPDSATAPGNTTSALAFAASGDTFNVSQDLQTGLVPRVPTPQPLWWFSLRGVDPNGPTNTSSADIESAPALYVKASAGLVGTTYRPTVFIGSAHEQETTSNVGRLYALDGTYGPSGNNGRTSPAAQPNPAAANYTGPGSFNYNVGQRPQLNKNDTSDWSFPDAVGTDTYSTGKSLNSKARPALGNITGSPVVFTNTDDTAAVQTRIYFAANSGKEYPAATRPDETQTGRVWAVNLDGSVGRTAKSGANGNIWAYPLANDPNDFHSDTTAEPVPPIGAFLRGTPALGFVQFPNVTTQGDNTPYAHADATGAPINGRAVPMLYIGTRGVNDTALYAVDIDGDETATADQRTIYREASPDGSIFQSSPALITNATIVNTALGNNGNGGAVYAVAGNTMYDYGATPISNPFPGQPYPLIRLDRTFVGIGPISSPTLAGADVSDFDSARLFLQNQNTTGTKNTGNFSTLDTDWIYVGDSSSGYCRGITPFDASYGGIPIELNQIIPYDPEPVQTPPLDRFIQTFLVDTQISKSSNDAKPIGLNAPLPVYEWGQSAYIRFTNAVPPNPPDKNGNLDATLFVYDTRKYTPADVNAATPTNPIPFYAADGTTDETITFDLADVDATAGIALSQQGGGQQKVQPRLITTPPDGFVVDAASGPPTSFPVSFPDVVTNLATTDGKHFLGTYTYAVGDVGPLGSAPGARRRVLNVKQTVNEYAYQGGGLNDAGNFHFKRKIISAVGDATPENLVTQTVGGKPGFNASSRVAAVDQPTFGILNPLGVRGGGINLLSNSSAAVPIGDAINPTGDAIGPFRSVKSPPTLSTATDPKTGIPTAGAATVRLPGDEYALQALANGDAIPFAAPPSSSGVAGDPTVLRNGANDATGVSTQTTPAVVVTATGPISHNKVGDNSEASLTGSVDAVTKVAVGQASGTGDNGLKYVTINNQKVTGFGGYGLNAFDRSALYSLGQSLRVKMTVPATSPNGLPLSRDGLYWNSNADNNGLGQTNHDSTVNFLPWETPPTPYSIGVNTSPDYPDIAPGNIAQNAVSVSGSSGGDLTSNSITLPPATGSNTAIDTRTVYGDPVQIQITVPHYQPANQQLYQQNVGERYTGGGITANHEIPPVDVDGKSQITRSQAFPMGYIAAKRLYVPPPDGRFSYQRPYRDVHIYTGVPIDMRTSVASVAGATTDVGKVPAAFGVQTEQYTLAPNPPGSPPGLFTPYGSLVSNTNTYLPSPFQAYFKPLEVHNDGNVNLLNVHFDQKINSGGPVTLRLTSDAVDPLSSILGYDLYRVTGAQNANGQRLSSSGATIPLSGTVVPEQSYLIRTSLDSDLVQAYGRNPAIRYNTNLPGEPAGTDINDTYPGATFHKPIAGSDQPSTLTVPDAPESYVAGASLPSSPAPIQPGMNSPTYKSAPFVSIAFPFGTPVGTYSTLGGQQIGSLQLFEGLDPGQQSYNLAAPTPTQKIPQILYPPQYSHAVGGIGTPSTTTTPLVDVYTPGVQPLSTTGTQLTGTVIEHRLTDGFTYGAVPMIDGGPAKPASGNNPALSTPDFAPAAFRDPASGSLSVYWTSGRSTNGVNGYGIYGANLPFMANPSGNTSGIGYFLPTNSAVQWWQPFTPSLAPGTNSGLSVAISPFTSTTAYDVAVTTAPYSNTLYSYDINPSTGALSNPQAVTPQSDASQVKYGIKALAGDGRSGSFSYSQWAFWTASTRGRTALYYNSKVGNKQWGTATSLLPVPAGLTAVSDASPLLNTAPVPSASGTPTYQTVAEVTYSGIGPDGNADLYVSRYLPDTNTPAQLDMVPFPAVTENLRATGGWYQARDVAWSRTGALNVSLIYTDATGKLRNPSLLYSTAAPFAPRFTKAIYDKASGYLVLTGVQVPIVNPVANGPLNTTNTVYVDAATGRIRFSPALLPTQTFPTIRATFSPMARRLTTDSRADVAPVTFLDIALKPNDAASIPNSVYTRPVEANRRWTIWRKTGVAGVGSTATLYFKTQRLTAYLPSAADTSKTMTITLNGTSYMGPVDVDVIPAILDPKTGKVQYQSSTRLFFPTASGAEGATYSVTYTPLDGTTTATAPAAPATDTVQWQDEILANDASYASPADSASGLDTVIDNLVPIQTATNENNVTAFLDPYAGTTAANGSLNPHKVWLFWNSTRNGTADIYSETIDPRFAPTPAVP